VNKPGAYLHGEFCCAPRSEQSICLICMRQVKHPSLFVCGISDEEKKV